MQLAEVIVTYILGDGGARFTFRFTQLRPLIRKTKF